MHKHVCNSEEACFIIYDAIVFCIYAAYIHVYADMHLLCVCVIVQTVYTGNDVYLYILYIYGCCVHIYIYTWHI